MKKIICLLTLFICILCFHNTAFADSVTLPDDLVDIEEEAFFQDTSITDATLPDGIKTIGAKAFAYSGLKTIYIPETIENIDKTAFEGLTEAFTIYAPGGSYGHQYAISNHYNWHDAVDMKTSYTIESEIGDYFVVQSIIDVGNTIDVKCYISPEYSGDDNTIFTIIYGTNGNCIFRDGLSLETLKRGITCSFSKNKISQHEIPSIISIHIDMKESYTVESEIGDYFAVKSITDMGNTIAVICYISPEYSENNSTLFTINYGINGNCIFRDGLSLEALKRGIILSFSKDTIIQHEIPSIISIHIDMKTSYTIESDIGDYFIVQSITDMGNTIDVRCYISPEYSGDDNTAFTINYGINGNCTFRKGLSLEALKRGITCSFSKNTISQYEIPPVISLRIE